MSRRTYALIVAILFGCIFNPQVDHEQAGHHSALLLSPASYNRLTGLMLCCPMTSHKKGYPFEVVTTDASNSPSVVLVDQVKRLD